MKYITRDGKAFDLRKRDCDLMPLLLLCALAVAIAFGLRLISTSHPEIIIGVVSAITDVAAAIWHMLRDIADSLSHIF